MNRRLILLSLVAVAAFAAAVAFVAARLPRSKPAAGAKQVAVPVVEARTWGETHPVIQLAAPPRVGPRDTAFVSLAIAELPPAIVENGVTIHMRVAVPDWLVLDDRGKVYRHADGVVLSVTNPDVGIGLELGRLELNPHARPAERVWHDLAVEVPPCVRRLALEARSGTDLESNNSYDQLLIHVGEPLEFRRGDLRGQRRSNDYGCPAGGCVTQPLPPKCAVEQQRAMPAVRARAGALKTGALRMAGQSR